MTIDLFAPAAMMLNALEERTVSSRELLAMHLERIERYNPTLNAIVTLNPEAGEMARAADEARAKGARGALLGLPIVIKDCIYVRGLPTTGGLVERADAVAVEDAPLAARVRAAGAVIIGKTNVPAYASDWQSDNPLFGRTNNPWDLSRTPGGSTGGGAAAVAAGLAPLEFGGDFGGSIRIPAAFCGIFGHKSSETALPRWGHFPGPNSPNSATGMATQGPLSRSAVDLERAFDVISGPDVGEDTAWHLKIPAPRHDRLSEFRVAVMPEIDWAPVHPEIGEALENLASRLSRIGARVERVSPDLPLREYFEIYLSIMAAISFARLPEEERQRIARQSRETGAWYGESWAQGATASVGDYLTWFGKRETYRGAYRSFYREWDILLAPANVVNAFPHRPLGNEERRLTFDAHQVDYMLQLAYPGLANLSGHPSTAFPAGLTRAGLPIGLQAIGPYLEDATPMRFAGLIEEKFGGFRPPPGYR